MYTQRGIMFLWWGKLTRTQIKLFDIFHIHLSYPKALTKMKLCSVNILWFHTLNMHILLIKRVSDESRSLGKTVFWARVSAPDAKNWNLSPYITILMGFQIILISVKNTHIMAFGSQTWPPKTAQKPIFSVFRGAKTHDPNFWGNFFFKFPKLNTHL